MVCRLPKVAMCGDEAGNDPISMCVEYLRCTEIGRWIAGSDGNNGSIVRNYQVAHEGIVLLGSHRKEPRIFYQQFGGGGEKSAWITDGKGKKQDENVTRTMQPMRIHFRARAPFILLAPGDDPGF